MDYDHIPHPPAHPAVPFHRDASSDLADEPSQPPVSPIMSWKGSDDVSDRHSAVSGMTANTGIPNLHLVNPPPAYVAPSGAVQVVTDHRAAHRQPSSSDDEDDKAGKDGLRFSPAGLASINAFLDQMLYSILASARSTTLSSLRPAVTEVLKSRLAREAIASANEELRELLAGNEEDEEEADTKTQHNAAGARRKWDLELVWKRTRLRVMVYMRLGEMEADDEQRFVNEEELLHGSERRFSQSTGLVSWAAAIFITSVLEYVAEQTLQVASQAAYGRARRRSRPSPMGLLSRPGSSDPVVVEEYDVEKIALNSTLGRLWRTWRRSLRNPTPVPASTRFVSHQPSNSQVSNEDMFSAYGTRPNSPGAAPVASVGSDAGRPSTPGSRGVDDTPELHYPEHVLASNIPLPMGDHQRDVDEIEVPGLAIDPDAPILPDTETPKYPARRNSFTRPSSHRTADDLHPLQEPSSPAVAATRTPLLRRRSKSVPVLSTRLPVETKPTLPGTFPVDEEAAEPEESEPGQKFHAEEMAPHKRTRKDVQGLLDKVADEVPPESAAEVSEDRADHRGMVGAAIAGASAAAAAAVALVYGAKDDKKAVPADEEKLGSADEEKRDPANEEKLDPADEVKLGSAGEEKTDQTDDKDLGQAEDKDTVQVGDKDVDPADKGFDQANNKDTDQIDDKNPVKVDDKEFDLVDGKALDQEAENNLIHRNDREIHQTDDPTLSPVQESSAKSDQEIEKFDTRKSLAGMKSLGQSDEEISERQPSTTEAVIALPSSVQIHRPATPPKSRDSDSDSYKDSYTLGTPERETRPQQQSLAPPRRIIDAKNTTETKNMRPSVNAPAQIAAVLESNAAAASARVNRAPSPIFTNERKANEMIPPSTRPARLILEESPPRVASKDDLTLTKLTESPELTGSPKGSPKRSTEILDKRSHSPSKNPVPPVEGVFGRPKSEQFKQTSKAQKRGSVPGIALTGNASQSPLLERSQHRQSWTAALERLQQNEKNEGGAKVPAVPSRTGSQRVSFVLSPDVEVASPPPVQDHPVIERIATMKRNGSVKRQVDSEIAALTSASIRGPEDFEMFVQGSDTVKYTLTPEPVRDEFISQPHPTVARAAELPDALARANSARRPVSPSLPDTRTGRTSDSKQATSATSAEDARTREQMKKDNRRSISRPPVRNTTTHRKSGLMAREPRIMTESTRDFADFIRSTGPSKEPDIAPILTSASRSVASLHSLRSAHVNGSRASSLERTKSLTKSALDPANAPPVPAVPRSNKSRINMEPRGAAGVRNGNSDLIDFIRNGPSQEGQHRISRSVAPFRSTMDSDQLRDLGDRINGTEPLELQLDPGASLGLGGSSLTAHPAHSGLPQRLSSLANRSTPSGSGSADPPRKRYRNKDPYAIDFDDEDDDLITALPKNKRNEVSLVEFLNTTGPSGYSAGALPVRNPITGRAGNPESTNLDVIDFRPIQNDKDAPPSLSTSARSSSLPLTDPARRLSLSRDGDAPRLGTPRGPNGAGVPDGPDRTVPAAAADDDGSAPAPVIGTDRKMTPKEEKRARKEEEVKKSKSARSKGGFFGIARAAKKTDVNAS